MTVIPKELGDEAGSVVHDHVSLTVPSGAPAQTSIPRLITEQQLMLGSAIAISVPVPDPAPQPRFNPFRAAARHLRRICTWEPDAPRRNLQHAHRTPDWYSNALMTREMRRL